LNLRRIPGDPGGSHSGLVPRKHRGGISSSRAVSCQASQLQRRERPRGAPGLAHPDLTACFQADHRNRAAEDCGIADRFWSAFYLDGYVGGADGCAGLTILQFQGDKGLEGKGPRVVMQPVGEA